MELVSYDDLTGFLKTIPAPVILLEGTRALIPADEPKLAAFARRLALDFPTAHFRSGNATGSDLAFASGVNQVDPARLQLILPYKSHRKSAHQALNYIVPLTSISRVSEQEVMYQTVQASPAYKSLVSSAASGGRQTSKASYILRDTLKVLGSAELQLGPATLAVLYINLSDPSGGGTGHTRRVCRMRGVPVIDQLDWMEWTTSGS